MFECDYRFILTFWDGQELLATRPVDPALFNLDREVLLQAHRLELLRAGSDVGSYEGYSVRLEPIFAGTSDESSRSTVSAYRMELSLRGDDGPVSKRHLVREADRFAGVAESTAARIFGQGRLSRTQASELGWRLEAVQGGSPARVVCGIDPLPRPEPGASGDAPLGAPHPIHKIDSTSRFGGLELVGSAAPRVPARVFLARGELERFLEAVEREEARGEAGAEAGGGVEVAAELLGRVCFDRSTGELFEVVERIVLLEQAVATAVSVRVGLPHRLPALELLAEHAGHGWLSLGTVHHHPSRLERVTASMVSDTGPAAAGCAELVAGPCSPPPAGIPGSGSGPRDVLEPAAGEGGPATGEEFISLQDLATFASAWSRPYMVCLIVSPAPGRAAGRPSMKLYAWQDGCVVAHDAFFLYDRFDA